MKPIITRSGVFMVCLAVGVWCVGLGCVVVPLAWLHDVMFGERVDL